MLLLTASVSGLFKWRQFEPEVILLAVGWYLRFSLSYRDVEELLVERGLSVDHVTVWRWVQRYAPAVERELAVNRRQLRIASPSAPVLPPSPTTEEVKSRSEPIRVRSSVMMHQMEVARQRRQQKLELFRTIKQMRGAGMKVNQIARQLGLCRRRIDKWIHFDELPERSRMQPRPGMPESFRDYLRQRWRRAAGMGARYSRRFGSSDTSVATRDWQNSFRRGASQKQRPEGRILRSPTHRNLKQQPRQDPDNCRRRWRRHS